MAIASELPFFAGAGLTLIQKCSAVLELPRKFESICYFGFMSFRVSYSLPQCSEVCSAAGAFGCISENTLHSLRQGHPTSLSFCTSLHLPSKEMFEYFYD